MYLLINLRLLIVKESLNDVNSDSGDIMATPKSSTSPFQLVLMRVSMNSSIQNSQAKSEIWGSNIVGERLAQNAILPVVMAVAIAKAKRAILLVVLYQNATNRIRGQH